MQLETIRDLLDGFEANPPEQETILIKEEKRYKSINVGQLTESVHSLGHRLNRMGIKKGDRIGIMAENRLEYSITYLAVTCIGAVIAPISILWETSELEMLIHTGELKMLFTSKTYLEKLIPVIHKVSTLEWVISFDALDSPVNNVISLNLQEESKAGHSISSALVLPDDTAEILFVNTSFGVELSHKAIISNVVGIFQTLQLDTQTETGKKSIMLLPYSHLYPTVLGILMPLLTGWVTLITTTAGIVHILRVIRETEPNYIFLVPLLLERLYTHLQMRLKKGTKTPAMFGMKNLEWIFTAGVKCPEPLIQNMENLGLNVLEGYGVSEMAPFITFSRPGKYNRGSAGFGLENVEIKILDPDENGIGEVVARGPNMMKGYYNQPRPTKDIVTIGGVYIDGNGWLHTGDTGYLDDEGFLFITGRSRNIIVTKGGTNIYPVEIEKRLNENQYIAQAKIVMQRDEFNGEYPYALIKAEKNLTRMHSQEEIYSLIQEQLHELNGKIAAYKIPKGFKLIQD